MNDEPVVTYSQVFAAWNADTRLRGRVPTVFPWDRALRGQLAERYVDSRGQTQYDPAPAEVEAARQAQVASEQGDIEAGKHALAIALKATYQWLLSVPESVLVGAAGITRRTVSEALGVPVSMIALVALGLGVWVVTQMTPRRR